MTTLAERIAVEMEIHAALGTTTRAKIEAIQGILNPTDGMIESALPWYSEGGCLGLDSPERREVVSAILHAALT